MTTDVFEAAGWSARRLGVVMTPDPGDPREALGVCNPAYARGADGELYRFPRLVAEGNYSRIGLARVRFDGNVPAGVERLGIALEPEAQWERHRSGGGVEDPRITYVAALGRFVMTYTGWGPLGPRIALATSADLERWERLGAGRLRLRTPACGPTSTCTRTRTRWCSPSRCQARTGSRRSRCCTGRCGTCPGPTRPRGAPAARPPRPAARHLGVVRRGQGGAGRPRPLTSLRDHRLVALPERPWEEAKLGGGTPPLRIEGGWLVLHHGAGKLAPGRVEHQPAVRYTAGAMLLDAEDVTRVLARSAEPLLEPELPDEREGVVSNVVFPTAIDPRGEREADVYYGMADARIGAFRLTIGRLPRQ